MFLQNKYTTWYNSIINNAQQEIRKKTKNQYFESHHIFPKCLGGDNRKSNLVLLTAKEHYICHLLLTKMLKGNSQIKMIWAFFRMKRNVSSSARFDHFRKYYVRFTTGEQNPFYGKKHSQKTLEKISKENHHMFGKKHSEESIERMRQAKLGKNIGEQNPMFGKSRPKEWRESHSKKLSGSNHFNYGKPAFNKGMKKIHNTIQEKMVKPENLELYLNNGWLKGRLPKKVHFPS